MPPKIDVVVSSARDVWNWLSKPDHAIAAAVLTLLNAGVTGIVTNYVSERHDDKARVERSVDSFRSEAGKFDALVLRYITALVDEKKVNPEVRRNLMENLIRQRQMLDEAVRLTAGDMKDQVASYQAAIDAVSREIPRADSVLTMQEFWRKTNQLALVRNDLFRRMNEVGV